MSTLNERLQEKASQRKKDLSTAINENLMEQAEKTWEFISDIFDSATPNDYSFTYGYTVKISYKNPDEVYYETSWNPGIKKKLPSNLNFKTYVYYLVDRAQDESISVKSYTRRGENYWEFCFKSSN